MYVDRGINFLLLSISLRVSDGTVIPIFSHSPEPLIIGRVVALEAYSCSGPDIINTTNPEVGDRPPLQTL
jgi:hypothetical protein